MQAELHYTHTRTGQEDTGGSAGKGPHHPSQEAWQKDGKQGEHCKIQQDAGLPALRNQLLIPKDASVCI